MKRIRLRWLGPLLISAWTVQIPAPVYAQASERGALSTATAEALFEQGREALKTGELNRACALLEGSQRVEPASGTQLLLAHCYEQLGRSASAWGLFREVASLSPENDKRRQIAQVRAEALAGTLARVIVRIETNQPKLLAELRITRDEIELPLSALGIAIPVDPGTHTFRISGPAIETWSTSLEVPIGPVTLPLLISTLEARRVTPPLASTPVEDRHSTTEPYLPQSTSKTIANSTSPWPWIVGAAGVLGVAAGTTLSLTARKTYSNSDEHCRTATLCDSKGLQIRSSARTQAAVATGAFAFAGVSLATAAILFLTLGEETPRDSALRFSLDASQTFAGLRLTGDL